MLQAGPNRNAVGDVGDEAHQSLQSLSKGLFRPFLTNSAVWKSDSIRTRSCIFKVTSMPSPASQTRKKPRVLFCNDDGPSGPESPFIEPFIEEIERKLGWEFVCVDWDDVLDTTLEGDNFTNVFSLFPTSIGAYVTSLNQRGNSHHPEILDWQRLPHPRSGNSHLLGSPNALVR